MWDGRTSLEEVVADYEPELDSSVTAMYIAYRGGVATGYIQSYVVTGHPDFWPDERDPGAVGIDMYLADGASLGRGLGSAMLKAFLDTVIFEDPRVTKVQVDPAAGNARAIRFYERAGFVRQGVVQTPDGPAELMVLKPY